MTTRPLPRFRAHLGPALLCAALAVPAFAQHPAPAPPELPQLQLSAEASSNVSTDELTVTLAYEQDGPVPASMNAAVLRQMNSALDQAQRVKTINARLNSVQTNPIWGPNNSRKGWRVRGELVLQSKDIAALSTLAGKLSEQLQLTGVSYGVSVEKQATAREALIAEAAKAFTSKARLAAKSLGFTDFQVANVNLGDGGFAPQPMMYARRGEMAAMAADAVSLPADGGTQRIAVTFSGSVTLVK